MPSVVYVLSPVDSIFVSSKPINQILDNYCLCDLEVDQKEKFKTPMEKIVPIEPCKTGKKKWIEEHDFTDKIELLTGVIKGLLSPENPGIQRVIVKSKRKSNNAKGRKWSRRRSQYIGVSKNGTSYQVLIAVDGRKTYLGSFEDETEAAVTFDFYSILLHSIEANTNFSYTASSIKEMITNYRLFNNTFNAAYYLQSNILM